MRIKPSKMSCWGAMLRFVGPKIKSRSNAWSQRASKGWSLGNAAERSWEQYGKPRPLQQVKYHRFHEDQSGRAGRRRKHESTFKRCMGKLYLGFKNAAPDREREAGFYQSAVLALQATAVAMNQGSCREPTGNNSIQMHQMKTCSELHCFKC